MNFDYRLILSSELNERKKSNSKYSLRGFARDLGIEATQLSRVLNLKGHVSILVAKRIAPKLFALSIKQQAFVRLCELNLGDNESVDEVLRLKVVLESNEKELISNTQLSLLPHWYYLAILDLFDLKNSPQTIEDISEALSLSLSQVTEALKALVTSGLLQKNDLGVFVKTNPMMTTLSDLPNPFLRDLHRSLIKKSFDVVRSHNVERRQLMAKTLTIRQCDLPELKSMIDSFFENLDLLVARNQTGSCLYQVNLQSFDLLSKSWNHAQHQSHSQADSIRRSSTTIDLELPRANRVSSTECSVNPGKHRNPKESA